MQVNAGTKIRIPVDGNCEITFVGNYAVNYTINGGDAITDLNKTYTYTGSKGYVELVAKDTTYFYSISTKHIAAPEYLAEGSYVFYVSDVGGTDLGKSEEKVKAIKGLTLEGTFNDFGNHGFKAASADAAFVLDLSNSATIVITTCCYGQGNVTSTSGDVTSVDVGEEGKSGKEYTIKGASGKTTVTLGAGAYIHSISVTYNKDVTLDTTKPDVWDFGAMKVAGANNLLTADIINGFYPEGTVAGSTGKEISSFEAKDSNGVVAIKFVTDKSNHRIRTSNTAITRYDEKTKSGANNTTYDGILYSNNASTADSVANSLNRVSAEAGRADHLDIYLYEGDTLTCMLGSNSNPANYKLYDPDSAEFAEFDFKNTYGVEAAVFHAAGEGWYQLYCTDEKLVCARITREHAPMVTVSGSIDVAKAEGIPAGYGVIYTNVETGKKTEMEVADGKYTGIVPGGYSYKVTLKDANGYVVRGGKDLTVGTDKKTVDNNLTVETVDQKTISGKVTGLTDAELTKVKFVFEIPEGYVFEPQITLTGNSYTLKVEDGVTYKVTALDVNDSTLKTTEVSAKDTDKTADIEFEKKTTYAVTLKITGVEDSSKAVVTFTNVDEKYTDGKTPYTYTFDDLATIKLRDGRYSVKVTGLGNYAVAQSVTPNVNVEGKAISDAPVPFNKLGAWDFAKLNDVIDIETIEGVDYYAGLVLTPTEPDKDNKVSKVAKNKTYLLGNSGTKVTVPGLKEGDRVTVTYCYQAAFTFDEGDAVSELYETGSGSTSTFESAVYTMKADGDLVISNTTGEVEYEDSKGKKFYAKQTYLCSIDVLAKADQVPYAKTITVGEDKTYKTINEALAAVRKMVRTDDQNVTIMIDPGDYEEMLVLDTPNVTLKNASATPSIKLKNEGVDIDDNAVRVTWYYGHGYTYYSMDTDCKYNADLLAANKLNGYASFKNPGSGTTNGSYWNATVVVTADKVSAEGIIFENSFNQYMSKKAAEDVIEKQSGAKELAGKPRAEMKAGDTTVQNKAYVERAAALAIYNDKKEISFDNCKFIGRQDTLYGGTGVTAAFYNCSVYGGTDYIFGGMTAVFAKCDLVFNTSEDNNDVGYITAAQTPEKQRGLLMWNCTVTSTTPGEDTASKNTSKAGYFGRPWLANSGEAVFYETIVEATCAEYYKASASLIQPVGWNSSLGGESVLSQEYNTHEWAMDVTTGKQLDNSAKRLSWSKVLTKDEAEAITVEAFLGDWKPFTAEALEIVVPTGMGKVNNMPVGSVDASKMTLTNLGADAEGKGQVEIAWTALHKAEADKYVITVDNKTVSEAK
ncbi:MAG: hypothetical protein K2N81_06865, partial [Acetatifactor sp.]|nr:hypothetical protein [Acetatifactor sp.]